MLVNGAKVAEANLLPYPAAWTNAPRGPHQITALARLATWRDLGAGAGPLVGPVLAAQMGYLPGLLWILAGVVFAYEQSTAIRT